MDLQNPKWMYLKAILFVFIGVCCFALVWMEAPTLMTAFLLLLMVWAFSRVYYFAFYVMENYIDREYRFSGLTSFFRYLLRKKRGKA
jgi:small-conductance mechanosensitive channel